MDIGELTLDVDSQLVAYFDVVFQVFFLPYGVVPHHDLLHPNVLHQITVLLLLIAHGHLLTDLLALPYLL